MAGTALATSTSMVVVRTFLSAVAVLAAATLAPVVHADVARHERVEVKPLNEKGEVVGLKVEMTIRPEQYRKVRIGIGPKGGALNMQGADHQKAAALPETGYLLHQFAHEDLVPNTPKKVSLEVRYKDAPKLQPGQEIEVISAFDHGPNVWHVFGMWRRGAANVPSFKAPGAEAPAQRRVGVAQIKRSGVAKRPASTTSRRSATPRARARAKPGRAR